MSVLLLLTFFLFCVNEVISNCPPNSGIYLMFNGDCYPSGSYINHIYITKGEPNYSPLKCALPNTILSGGQWVDPNGNPLTCNTNPLHCDKTNNPASISLYRLNDSITFNEAVPHKNYYKCCLPTNCSDPTTNMITVNIFLHVEIISHSVVELPSDMTVVPQQYTVQCILSGIKRHFRWYYVYNSQSIEFDCSLPSIGYSCINESHIIYNNNNTISRTINMTWNGEKINSGIFSQSNNNGDHKYRCYEKVDYVRRNQYLTVTAPGFTPSPPTLVNKTATTITVSWRPVSSDADGYVVNATSDTHTVTQQVKGGSQNEMTLKGLIPVTTYNITIRAYQDILGPASNTISVQTLFSVILSVNWTFISSITELQNTQYHINCMTITVNVTTDVYWLVNGVMKNNSMYILLDSDLFIYNNTLLVYPDPLGMSVNVTCIAMYKGVNYSDTVILQVPSGPPSNVMAYILNETSIKVNWTMSSQTNGYVVVINSTTGVGTNKILSTTEHEVIFNGLTLSTYNINVYSYKDLPSISSTQTLLRFNVPTPVTSLLVTNVSTTTITINWTSLNSNDGNYVTYYNISYSPYCFELFSVNVTLVSVISHQSITTFSYILSKLLSGMNYIITMRAGNVLGESNPIMTFDETKPTSVPFGSPKSIMALSVNLTSNKIIWEDINCHLRNGRIIEYIVIISNNSVTYNLTSTERYIIINDLVFGNVYNMSVAGVNSVGRGPFSDSVQVQIGTVPGPVGTLSSLMSTTWAVISWSVPSYIPVDYPIITYEIGHTTHQSNGSCSPNDEFSPMIKTNKSSTNMTIHNLIGNTCYLFGVRGYTVNGYGVWTISANQTLVDFSTTTVITNEVIAGGAVGAIVLTILLIVVILIVVCVVRQRKINKKSKQIYNNENFILTEKKKIRPQTEEQQYAVVNKLKMSSHYSLLNTAGYENVEQQANIEISLPEPEYSAITDIPIPTNTTHNKSQNGGALYTVPSSPVHVPPPTINFDPQIPPTLPISVDDLGTHVASCHSDSNAAFSEQYKGLYKGEDKPCTVGFSKENKLLNRFKNITTYDDNRIVLIHNPELNQCQREYINASYIDGYSCPKKFIASQGPMTKTLVDFWCLIWQERPQIIVMVTNLKEGSRSKCEQYWPDPHKECTTFGPFIVTILDEQVLPDFTIRSLKVKIEDGSNHTHDITQYHLTSWPDQGVPDYVTPLMILHKRVTNTWSPSKGPILVHCSAGVGRTGTYIAVDIALEQASREGVVDIAGIINRLREQRMKMVQTAEQYAFVHDAVLETIICGETDITAYKYQFELQKLKNVNSKTHQTGLESQFNLLSQITPDPDDVYCNTAKINSDKNRSDKYLPPERFLVTLHGTKGYIHASFLNGYREKKAFIITQSPMENTTRDFWKMIMDYKVSAIVMLCGLEENGKETCYQYWPTTDIVQHGEYCIRCTSEEEKQGYIVRNLLINNLSNEGLTYNLVQFQVLDWPNDGCVRQPQTLLQVIDGVIKVQQKIGGGPIVVHCSDTVSHSGVYCSLSIALEQCKTEGVIDVFQVTKAVKRSKPGAVTTLEQYTSIYDVIQFYLSMNSTYANFSL